MTNIYLDYNASAPLRSEARDIMISLLNQEDTAYNASSVHYFGREGRKIVEDSRQNVANLVGAEANQVIFNSGATEGNNTVLKHFAAQYPSETILVSSIEHPSVLESTPNTKTYPVDENGCVRLDRLEEMLSGEDKVSLVSCMYVNNESGVIQDIPSIAALAHKYGALFHCDAVQGAGRLDIDIKQDGIDFLTLSSHKIGGPQGVGALVLGLCGQTPILLFGGGQEKAARAGTENVAGIAGFGAAAKAARAGLDTYKTLEVLRDKLESGLKGISSDLIVHGESVKRVANTSFFSVPGANTQSLLMSFDLEKISVSNGSACSSGSVKPSVTLQAMGVDEKNASSALRVSMGWATKESDVDAFLKAWQKIYKRIKAA